MKILQRSGQAHFLRASTPDSFRRIASLLNSLFAARACVPKCEPDCRLSFPLRNILFPLCAISFLLKEISFQFILIGLLQVLRIPVLCFFIPVPDLCSRKIWWLLLQQCASSAFKLGSKGDIDILPVVIEDWDVYSTGYVL